jgi:cell pole-organizing protein PopZ
METELVSPSVAEAAAATMAQLAARRASQAIEHNGGDGLLVETLVRQAVEPMLRDWLDVHLQAIVERLVRREVERIARKAELG